MPVIYISFSQIKQKNMNFLLLAENLSLNKLITVSWDYLAMDFFVFLQVYKNRVGKFFFYKHQKIPRGLYSPVLHSVSKLFCFLYLWVTFTEPTHFLRSEKNTPRETCYPFQATAQLLFLCFRERGEGDTFCICLIWTVEPLGRLDRVLLFYQ